MKRVTGLGGFFFKAKDTQKLKDWYRDHLGFKTDQWGATFAWADVDGNNKSLSRTQWSLFKEDTTYYAPSPWPFMVNFRVHDLRQLLEQLKKENVEVVGTMEEYEYGKFAWILDPEKRKIELWEPADEKPEDAPPVWKEKVTGIGGVFFKSEDPKSIAQWYERHLGVGQLTLRWTDLSIEKPKAPAHTVWAPFKNDTTYFAPSEKPFMLNYRVANIDKLLTALKNDGIPQLGDVQQFSYGKFASILDPEGNKIELWEPTTLIS